MGRYCVNMIRSLHFSVNKAKILAVLSITTLSLLTPQANAAAVKNGVACSKAGTNIKVGGKSYSCAKNPYVRPKTLTWTSSGCLKAYQLWKSAKSDLADWADIAKLAGEEGQKTIDELSQSILSLEELMKNEACKRGA